MGTYFHKAFLCILDKFVYCMLVLSESILLCQKMNKTFLANFFATQHFLTRLLHFFTRITFFDGATTFANFLAKRNGTDSLITTSHSCLSHLKNARSTFVWSSPQLFYAGLLCKSRFGACSIQNCNCPSMTG
ncbi:hypothetical protein XENTR_v10019164 [Xenopus tropicalis]|nr:hypothetical protein XENTR_v10019164 [Xenopus tropicalis]